LLQHWLGMKDRCPSCGLALDRGEESDFWLGAYAINLVIAEGFAAVVGAIVLWRTWPESTAAEWIAITLAVIMPIVFFPFSRTLWLAWDLSFRPSEQGD
jgi:hypothetical protein